MGKQREQVRLVEVVCRTCGTEYTGEMVMKSRAVPGVMGPVGEVLKNAMDNCPDCGSYNVQPKRT